MGKRKSDGGEASSSSKKSKKPEDRSFKENWLKEDKFKPFLIKKNDPDDNCLPHPYCNACGVYLANKKHNIKVHMESSDHKTRMATYNSTQQQAQSLSRYLHDPIEDNVKSLETRLALLTARRNLSHSVADEVLGIFKAERPNDAVISRASMGKTKTGNFIRQAIGEYVTSEVANSVKNTFYSTTIDESTDVSTKNKMAIVVSHWDGQLHSKLLKLKRVKDASAEGLSNGLLTQLDKSKIPRQQMVGFSADTCNAMFGSHNSVTTKLIEEIPHLLTAKCACHNSHLVTSKSFALLPKVIEEFVRQLPSFFSGYKNKDGLAEFQTFCQTPEHAILKPGFTRWLTLQPCAKRIVEQYNPLLLFFTSLVQEKPTEISMKMLSLLKDPFTKCYLAFMVEWLAKFNKFNAKYQSQEPLLQDLRDDVYNLILELARSFMDKNYVNSFKNAPFSIDPRREQNYLPLHSIYLGGEEPDKSVSSCKQPLSVNNPKQKQYYTSFFPAEKADADKKAKKYADEYIASRRIPVPDKNASPSDPIRKSYEQAHKHAFESEFELSFTPIDYFYVSIRKFYANAIIELQKRFNFDDPIYDILPMVKPSNARDLSPQSLTPLFRRYPILRKFTSQVDAEREWRDHITLPNSYFNVSMDHEYHDLDLNFYWNRVFSSKYPSGEPRFPNLKVCISLLLCLPSSNAPAERCFSNMLETKSEKKIAMHDETVDAQMKGKEWQNSQKKRSDTVTIPSALLQMAKKVRANATIHSDDE